jgi:hypothetical protein
MRSEQEMLLLVRDKLTRLRRRRRLAALGGAALAAVIVGSGLGFIAADDQGGRNRVRTTADAPEPPDDTGAPSTTAAPGPDSTAPPPDPQAAMPDVTGLEAEEADRAVLAAGLGDGPYDIDRRYIADPGVPSGHVMGQTPLPGAVVDLDVAIVLEISAGGPVVRFDELPPQARSFVDRLDAYEELPGVARSYTRDISEFDRAEPILVVTTDQGTAYKTDNWLFGSCAAVDAAYRTFPDPTYNDDCY